MTQPLPTTEREPSLARILGELELLGPNAFGPRDLAVLAESVGRENGLRQIADRLKVAPSTICRAAGRLEASGLARRVRSDVSSTAVEIVATPAGRAKLAHFGRVLAQATPKAGRAAA